MPDGDHQRAATGAATNIDGWRRAAWLQRLRRHRGWVIGVVLALLCAMLPRPDEIGAGYVDDAFRRALIGFALARGLNGVISVAQGTEFAVQPAGVGVSFTPGEILDPVNDLVERFSWIMLLSTSSLGVQKVLLSMSAWQGLLLALVIVGLLLLASIALWHSPRARHVLSRVFLFLLILRFMMPAVAIANEWVYRAFLQKDYTEASAELQQAQETIGQMNDEVIVDPATIEDEGLVDRARRLYEQVAHDFDISARLEAYSAAAETISENAIRLIVVFLMQTLVFPLVFLYIVFGVIRRVTRW